MNSKVYLEEIKGYFLRVMTDVKINTACGHYDINGVAENFYLPILSIVFNCPNLRNLNYDKQNYPAVDLGCDVSKFAFQITSTSDSKKIAHTLQKFKEHDLDKRFDRLIIFIITEKQSSYTAKDVLQSAGVINFDIENSILDYTDLLKLISRAGLSDLETLVSILRKEFDKVDKFSSCREQLDAFLLMSRGRVDVEKRSKKYIPDIFVEVSTAKDKARMFTHPAFFGRKIFDGLDKIDHIYLNEYLERLGIPLFCEIEYSKGFDTTNSTYKDLLTTVATIKKDLIVRRSQVMTYCEYYKGEDGGMPEIPPDKKDIWLILKLKISGAAYGLVKYIDSALDAIQLTESQIMLVTSMAGQGKTNFICDFAENFCSKFDLPAVLIPARELNTVPNQSIVQYLLNNRYLSQLKDKFELFGFFEQVAVSSNKPFVILVDGLNEIKNTESFRTEINDVLTIASEYPSIKFILTCRTEFFEQKFSYLLNSSYSEKLYHLKNLKAEMEDFHLNQALTAYFNFFNITADLSEDATDFLKRDLLLLRIFCENNQGCNLGKIDDIYKEELFENYLLKVIDGFGRNTKIMALPTLFKLVNAMIEDGSLASMSTEKFSGAELEVIEHLVNDEIILRHEMPEIGLMAIGHEYVNFTYDELRDFIIAYYLVMDVSVRDFVEYKRLVSRIMKGQAYEGMTKFSYILSRKHHVELVSSFIEEQDDFLYNYSILLHSFSPKYHIQKDIQIIQNILSSKKHALMVRRTAAYLFNRDKFNEILNLNILVNHINSLGDEDYVNFLRTIFDTYGYSYREDSQPGKLVKSYTNDVYKAIDSLKDDLFIFLLQVASSTQGGTYYDFVNACVNAYRDNRKLNCFEYVARAKSKQVQQIVGEIITRGDYAQKK